MKKLCLTMLLLFTPFVYSQESIGFDKFRLGMNKSDIMDIIYSNYQGWRLSKLDTALPTYDLIRDDTYSILLSFHSDDTLRGIGIHQRFDDIKSARVENKRLVDILTKKYGKVVCKTSSKTFLINEWAKDDHQYITLNFVFMSDRDVYYYCLEYWDSRYTQSMVSRIKNKNKQKNDDSDKY